MVVGARKLRQNRYGQAGCSAILREYRKPPRWSCRDDSSLVASNQSAIIAEFAFEALTVLWRDRTAHPAIPAFGLAQVRPRLILLAFCVVASHGAASIFRLRLTTKRMRATTIDFQHRSRLIPVLR
jgi:hypothetical protein